jgi:vacuolar-type H+-ATPase subunit I/STV1
MSHDKFWAHDSARFGADAEPDRSICEVFDPNIEIAQLKETIIECNEDIKYQMQRCKDQKGEIMKDFFIIEESETDGLIRQLSEAQAKIEELTFTLEDEVNRVAELQRICDDQADRLRRIADPNLECFDCNNCAAAKIASGPLGPNFRGMCAKMASTIELVMSCTDDVLYVYECGDETKWTDRDDPDEEQTKVDLAGLIEEYEAAKCTK